jgi:cell division cycle 2-like
MWSVGCIFAELILRKPLFAAQKEIEQIDKVCYLIFKYERELLV